jgi:hypothetical protein
MWLRRYFGGAGGVVGRSKPLLFRNVRRESGYLDFGHNGPCPQTVETGHQRKWPMPFKRCQAISVSWRDD